MTTRFLLWCGVLAGPIFVLAFLVEGATRPDYNPLRHPVSSLALGELGWTQTANFVVCGALSVAYAVGLRRALRPGKGRTWGPILVGIWGVGLIGAGIFVTDPVSGYPPGTSETLRYTTTGALHDAFSIPTFVSLPIVCLVLTRRFAAERAWGWVAYSLSSAVLFGVGFLLASTGFSQTPGWVDYGGLLQRLTVTTGWLWLSLLAIRLLRRAREAG